MPLSNPDPLTPAPAKRPINVLFVSPEVAPYAKTGGLADVSSALPKALGRVIANIRVVMPLYKCVINGGYALYKIASKVWHPLLGHLPKFDVYASNRNGIETYFIDHKEYFNRDELYGSRRGDYPDNAYRFGFFSKAALAFMKTLELPFDIIHCHDWQTALVPFYLKFKLDQDPFYQDMKVLYTIHNLAYQGHFHRNVLGRLDIPPKFFNMYALEFYRKVNLMKSGILYSDAVTAVSRGYAREILTDEYGCGLHGLLNTRINRLFGITNGVDYSEWDPAQDKDIARPYDHQAIEAKQENKKELLALTGLSLDITRPVAGVVTRLAWQKGIDLIANIVKDLAGLDVGIVILGKGEPKYEQLLLDLARKYPRHLSVTIDFNNALAHKIEAGSDLFLMPSRYEPCGLNQMYSLRYGTIPVVRATGGLDDVITDFDENPGEGNGFKFAQPDERDFLRAVKRALNRYNDKALWSGLIRRVMRQDFSWDRSATEYVELYERIRAKTGKMTF